MITDCHYFLAISLNFGVIEPQVPTFVGESHLGTEWHHSG